MENSMHVCLCFDIKDVEIEEYVKEGSDTLEKLQHRCGASTGCGMCYDDLVLILEKHKPEPENIDAPDPIP